MNEEEKSSLERVRERLYAQTTRKDAHGVPMRSKLGWAPAQEHFAPEPTRLQKKERIHGSAVFLFVSFAFFLIATSLAAYFLISGGRSVSTEQVAISFEAPISISSGDTVPLLIEIQNRNPVAMLDGTLSVSFPEGTYDENGQPMTVKSIEVGTLTPGQKKPFTVRAKLFGTENERKSISYMLQYGVENSNATFQKRDVFEYIISSSPISLQVETLNETVAGQEIELLVRVRGNSKSEVGDVAVQAFYPFGFTLVSASQESGRNGVFPLGRIAQGEEREIRIRGFLVGNDGDERVFRFEAGTQAENRDAIAINYIEARAEVLITKPFFDVRLALNQQEGETLFVTPGERVSGTIQFSNTLTTALLNGQIEVEVRGNALEVESVESRNGFFRSKDNTLVFSRDTIPALRELQPGAQGSTNFSFSVKNAEALNGVRDPEITIIVSARGDRPGEGIERTISSSIVRTVAVSSSISIFVESTRARSPFQSTGPVPPVVDAETEYAVLVSVRNSVNPIAGATVTAELPSYVEYTGSANPQSAFSYNAQNRTVTWNIGNMEANTTQTGAFEVSFTPSISHRGTAPLLADTFTFFATDRNTQREVRAENGGLLVDIRTVNDAGYTVNKGQVQ